MARQLSHLSPENCYVCGGPEHPESGHKFWSNRDAQREFEEEDRKNRGSHSPEARYVETYRPY